MIDLTKPSGIIFIVIAFISLVALFYSIEEFIRWQIRHMKNEDFDLPPFAVVGAVVIGMLIMVGVGYTVFYIWATYFSQAVNEVISQINSGLHP